MADTFTVNTDDCVRWRDFLLQKAMEYEDHDKDSSNMFFLAASLIEEKTIEIFNEEVRMIAKNSFKC
jgi:hypothetical protein